MMKKIILSLVLISCSVLAVGHFWRGRTMSLKEVGDRWGKADLNIEKFREGDSAARSTMAYSILKKKKEFKGKFVLELRKELGDPNGFYFSDVFPAYFIQEGKTRQDETWQIVFLLDQSRHVEDIIVHKNCCTD